MTYYEFREQVWPYGRLWGDRDERKAVRDYLRKKWEENNAHRSVENTLENARREKDIILNWWWRDRYGQSGEADTTNQYFGQFLLSKYQEANNKVTYRDNKQRGRF